MFSRATQIEDLRFFYRNNTNPKNVQYTKCRYLYNLSALTIFIKSISLLIIFSFKISAISALVIY